MQQTQRLYTGRRSHRFPASTKVKHKTRNMNMENTEQATEHNIVNSNFESSSSTNFASSSSTYDTSSGMPEVTPAPRSSLPKIVKSRLQEEEITALRAQLKTKEHDEQTIAALQAQLRAREHELTLTQRQVTDIMTQSSSPSTDFPDTPPYISFTLAEKIKQMTAEKARRDKELNEAIQYLEIQRLTEETPRRSLETPGPHRLQEKVQRQQDLALQHKIQQQEQAEALIQATNNSTVEPPNPNQNLVDVFKQLTLVMKDNTTADTTDPAPFNGSDEKWDEFYSQLRTYLAAKDWLETFEHPTGPGAAGFNNAVNRKIYNKLIMLCKNGHALTYIKKAAEFDGHGAGKELLLRYDGYSKQRHRTLRKTIEQLRHVNGTNITKHIDVFEKICGQMAHNNPVNPPTEEQRIDWFLDTVHERTYDSVHASCVDAHLEGKLTFAKLVKLYTHKCFQRYPHFQLSEIDSKIDLSNNANSLQRGGRKEKGKGKMRYEKGKGQWRNDNRNIDNRDHTSNGEPSRGQNGKGKGKGRQKGKGRGTNRTQGNRTTKETCGYCGIPGHSARECRKRQSDEKTTQEKTSNKKGKEIRNNAVQIVDELDLQFSNNVTYVEPVSEGKLMRTGSATNLGEGASEEAQSSTVEPEPLSSNNESKESDEENKSDTDDDNREYYIAIIDGVRYLQYYDLTNNPQSTKPFLWKRDKMKAISLTKKMKNSLKI